VYVIEFFFTNAGLTLYYLVAVLYRNACEHCKASFQRIASAGVSSVSESGLAAGSVPTMSSGGNLSAQVSSSSQPDVHRTQKCRETPPASTDGQTASRIPRRPRIPTPGASIGQHGATTSRICSPKPGSSHASRDGVSTEQIKPLAVPYDPKVSVSPPEGQRVQLQYFVKFPDGTVGKHAPQMTVERELTHRHSINSVKFSPDGKYLAVGVADIGFDSQKTYLYEVTGRQIW
jgi:hypothetical protein